jgi:hypothetical protein
MAITVKEFIEILSKFEQDRIVIVSTDVGNGRASPLDTIERSAYVPETEWCGDLFLEELTPDDIKNGYCDEDLAPEDAEKAIVLWPSC